MSATAALRTAFWNAMHVLYAGVVFFALYLTVLTVGPATEGWAFPVIKDYKLINVRHSANGSVSFATEFEKARDCTYYGVSWFAPDEKGNLTRIQVRRVDGPSVAPETGPVGRRTGQRQVIVPPEGTQQFYGIMHHDCGFLWQIRTKIGPFAMEDGRLVRGAN